MCIISHLSSWSSWLCWFRSNSETTFLSLSQCSFRFNWRILGELLSDWKGNNQHNLFHAKWWNWISFVVVLFMHAISQPCSWCFCHWSTSLSKSLSVLQDALIGKGLLNCNDGNAGAQEPTDNSNSFPKYCIAVGL